VEQNMKFYDAWARIRRIRTMRWVGPGQLDTPYPRAMLRLASRHDFAIDRPDEGR
jgi:hypothetical protein